MSTINRAAFVYLIEGNLEWLLKQPPGLERDHIEAMLRDAPRVYYDLPLSHLARRDRVEPAACCAEMQAEIALMKHDEACDQCRADAENRCEEGSTLVSTLIELQRAEDAEEVLGRIIAEAGRTRSSIAAIVSEAMNK